MVHRSFPVCVRAGLAAMLLALGAGPGIAQTTDPTTAELLARQADAWDKAIVRQDRAAIEGNMTEDFRQIDGDGDIENKTSFVDGLMSPKLRIDPYTVEELEIRIYGDVALLSGRTRMTGAYDGKPFRSHYRYIDIYVRKDGQWRIASVQITRLRP